MIQVFPECNHKCPCRGRQVDIRLQTEGTEREKIPCCWLWRCRKGSRTEEYRGTALAAEKDLVSPDGALPC